MVYLWYIYGIQPRKFDIDTKNDGLENVFHFKYVFFGVSMLNFVGYVIASVLPAFYQRSFCKKKRQHLSGSTISTLLHDRINPKDCQVLFLGDTGFLQFFRVVSRDYGKPRLLTEPPTQYWFGRIIAEGHNSCF